MELTVGLLVAGASSRSTELLGLATTWIGNQQGPVALDQDVLNLLLGGLNKILVVGVQGFGDSLKDSTDLCEISTTLHSDFYVNSRKHFLPSNSTGYRSLYRRLGFHHFQGSAIHLDKAIPGLGDTAEKPITIKNSHTSGYQ